MTHVCEDLPETTEGSRSTAGSEDPPSFSRTPAHQGGTLVGPPRIAVVFSSPRHPVLSEVPSRASPHRTLSKRHAHCPLTPKLRHLPGKTYGRYSAAD